MNSGQHQRYTNCVLQQKGKETVYYIPAYLRVKVKNFTEMNLESLDAQMNATFIFTVFYGDLDKAIGQQGLDELINGVVFLFNRDDALQLKQGLEVKKKVKPKEKQFTFTIRKLIKLRIDSEIFWSPFEVINLILSITLNSIDLKVHGKRTTVRFNLMDCQNNFLKISYSEEGTFGNYDLAERLLKAQYSNERVPQKLKQVIQKKHPKKAKKILQDDLAEIGSPSKKISQGGGGKQKVKHFQYAHFTIPLYKFPTVTVATIFLPLWLLGIINLGIFFQDNNLADRIASIAALMIAFVALIPTIRAQIPPSPNITFVEILVYTQTLTSFFCLVHSLIVRNDDEISTTFLWYNDALFMISALITILTIISVVILYLVHKLIWEPSYNRDLKQEKDEKFSPSSWFNELCDVQFKKFDNIVIHSTFKPKQKDMIRMESN